MKLFIHFQISMVQLLKSANGISNSIPHFTGYVITYLRQDLSWSMLVKEAPELMLTNNVAIVLAEQKISAYWSCYILTYFGLVMPYSNIDRGQHWLR